MGRRKHQFYKKDWMRSKQKQSHTKEADDTSSVTRIVHRTNEKILLSNETTTNPTYVHAHAHNFCSPRLTSHAKRTRLKRKITQVCGLSAAINWLITLLGYFAVHRDKGFVQDEDVLKATSKYAACVLSAAQMMLVVLYWEFTLRYTEMVRGALNVSHERVPRLCDSPGVMVMCGIECAVQVVGPIPSVNWRWHLQIFGSNSELTIDDLLYFAVLIKNYHSLRFLFWFSHFSDLRTQIFTTAMDIPFGEGFLFRSYLADYHIYLILGIFLTMVVLSGIVDYVFEHESPFLSNQWNVFWVVTYTQVTIGYGDGTPDTFFGQVTMLISCFFGVFTLGLLNTLGSGTLVLNLTECSLYSELLYTRCKDGYRTEAVELIQCWWRLMRMRMTRKVDARTITSFYSQLRVYRSTLVVCQHVKDTRFERQIDAFEKSIHSQIRPLNEYLHPIQDAYALVLLT